ncbi:two-component system response regulator [Paramagnetospirillum kuznetsovii]|uniref:Two-component system response regulator n=1 Tax=Paramagnetospirillum kuznetsovii TaxID=2053833 RepID=A0A364NXX5_9PROT|nr:HD domain-containing phosphohydrolase [Paramagnetospirillum kuznetsovii]RAU21928.1 two-component system response regulator [Paramagnetospirillum kuznetsovii]
MNGIDAKILSSAILILDDTRDNVDLLEMMLLMAGYSNITIVTDSREVETLFQKNSYDLLLLDIRMPHLDGFQVMERLATLIQNDYLPVLVLTAQQDRDTRIKALEQGAKDFLTKPFDRAETLMRIRNLLEVRVLYNERRQHAETLERKVLERTRELEDKALDLNQAQVEIIRSLGRIAEYRDTDTADHTVRVANICRILALACGLGEEAAELIALASPLHDVGKVAIPDCILLKPGPLDADELKVMRTHSMLGHEILGSYPSPLLDTARLIASAHHEKWDGSGYPNGLRGEEIPIEARIVAIADVFDALNSDRPYKNKWAIDATIGFIKEQAGIHFDPTIVDAFLRSLPTILRSSTV